MARQSDQYHTRFVQEDLRYLDEFCRAHQTGKYWEQYPQNQQLVYHGPQVFTVRMPAAVATSNHTAQFYCGTDTEPAITSNKAAAEQYGGIMITDYNRGKKHYGGFNGFS